MRNSEKGFALPLALLLLVVMTLMGAALVSITAGDIRANSEKDTSQQTFYAAESGISDAKKLLASVEGGVSKMATNPWSRLKFCKPDFVTYLRLPNPKALYDDKHGKEFIKIKNLSEVISVSGDEKTRLDNFSFEYFITYSADFNGFVDNPKKKPGTNKTLYTIHSCGCDKSKSKCNKDKDTITALEAIVTRTVE